MDDIQMRFEALRLASGALCSGKFPVEKYMDHVQKNYDFLKAAKTTAKAKKRK